MHTYFFESIRIIVIQLNLKNKFFKIISKFVNLNKFF